MWTCGQTGQLAWSRALVTTCALCIAHMNRMMSLVLLLLLPVGLVQSFGDHVCTLHSSHEPDDVPGIVTSSHEPDDVPGIVTSSHEPDDVPGIVTSSHEPDDVPGIVTIITFLLTCSLMPVFLLVCGWY